MIRRLLWIGAGGILLLLGVLLLVLVSPRVAQPVVAPVRAYLLRTGTAVVSQSLNGSLEVGALQGSLLSAPVLRHIVLRDAAGSVVGQLDEVRLRYHLAGLMRRRLLIHEMTLIRPQVTLIQEADGSWNFSGLVSTGAAERTAPPEEEVAGGGLPIDIELTSLRIRDGQLNLRHASLPGLRTVEGLQVQARGAVTPEGADIELQQVQARTQPAQVVLRTLSGAVQQRGQTLRIEDLRLETDNTLVTVTGTLPGGPERASLEARLKPLDVAEIGRILADDNLRGHLQMTLTAEGPPEALRLHSQLNMPGGALAFNGRFDIQNTPLRYQGKLDITQLNLASLAQRAAWQSDLNLHLDLQGSGTSLSELQGHVRMDILPSHVGDMMLNPSQIHVEAASQRLQVQRFHLDTSVARMSMDGVLDLSGTSALQYDLQVQLPDLRQLLGTDDLDGVVHLTGRAEGDWPNLTAHGTLQGQNIRYQANQAHTLHLTYEASQLGAQPHATAELQVEQVALGTFPVAALALQATYDGDQRQLRFATQAQQSSDYDGAAGGTLTLSDTGQDILLDTFRVRLEDHTWHAPEPLDVALGGDNVRIRSFRLVHEDESLALSGNLAGTRLDDLRLHATQIDLDFLRRLLALPELVGGRANLQTQVSGTFDDPQLQSELTVHTSPQPSVPFERFHATLDYAQQQLQGAVHLTQQQKDVLALHLDLPLRLAFTSMPIGERLVAKPVAIRLDILQPDLPALHRRLPQLPALTGSVQGAINLQGTYDHLHLDSTIELQRLGLTDAIEQLRAPLHLQGAMITAASVPALAEAFAQGHLAPTFRDLELSAPTISGRLPNRNAPASSLRLRNLLIQAEGQWTPQGLHATLHTLQLQAQALGLPRTTVALAGVLTPEELNLTRLKVRLPQSELRGQGHLALADQTLQFNLAIPRLRLDELPLALPDTLPRDVQGELTLQGRVQAPRVTAHLRYAGARINADMAAQLQDTLPRYQATLRVDALDMAQFAPDMRGRVHAGLTLQGTGLTEQNRRARLDLDVDSTHFALAPGLAARLRAEVNGAAVRLNTFRVQSEPVEFVANGTLSQTQQADLTYTLTLNDLTSLQEYLGVMIEAQGQLKGEVTGPLQALRTQGALRIKPWRYATLQGQALNADFTATNLPAAPQGSITAQVSGLQGPSLPNSALQLQGAYKTEQGTFDLSVTQGPFQHTQLAGHVRLPAGQHLTLSTLRLQKQDWVWANPAPIEIVRNAQGRLQLRDFVLQNGDQEIRVQGSLSPDGAVAGNVGLQHLHIRPNILALAPNAAAPDGDVQLDLTLSGTLQQPEANGALQLAALQWQKQSLGDVHATLGFANDTLRTDLSWRDQQAELLRVNGTWGLDAKGAVAMRVQASDFDLARLTSLSQAVRQSAGSLNLDLRLAGTQQQPEIHGDLAVRDGTLQLDVTGERYQDIRTRLRFAGNRVNLEAFHVGSRSGSLQLQGWLQSAGLALDQLDITMKAQDFTAMYTPAIEAVVTSDLTARGSLQALAVSGDVTIPRARIRVEGLLGGGPAAVKPEELTVEGVYGPGVIPQATSAGKTSPTSPLDPLSFLQANVNIDLPRNIWVQAHRTAIELQGNVDVTKERGQPLILAGSIETLRGFASYLGKKFVLEQGQITFTGSEEIDPFLDVTATHKVSDYVVSIHVEGKSTQPKLILSSDPELEEADIVSLLLLGKTTDRLTSSEEGALSNTGKKVAGSVASGALEQTVGAGLGLDTIEVEVGNDPGSGRVGTGKYITQDIFLSYERQLGKEGGNTVGVEFSLNRRLKLKGTSSDIGESAVDLMWRHDY